MLGLNVKLTFFELILDCKIMSFLKFIKFLLLFYISDNNYPNYLLFERKFDIINSNIIHVEYQLAIKKIFSLFLSFLFFCFVVSSGLLYIVVPSKTGQKRLYCKYNINIKTLLEREKLGKKWPKPFSGFSSSTSI